MDYLTMEENVCPVCGKLFYTVTGREWGWRYKGSNYCSYHCMRHVEIRHRVDMGWQKNTLGRDFHLLSADAKGVAERLIRLRHLKRAATELKGAKGQDRALSAIAKRVEQLSAEATARWQPAFDALDDRSRRIAYALFVDGAAVNRLAQDLDIDLDLLVTKLAIVYEALARAGV